MGSGAKDCCSGNNAECQNATIRVTSKNSNGACEVAVDAHGWIVVHSNNSATNNSVRQVKYLNNNLEQDYRFIKRLVKPGMGFASFNTAR
ncbi:MAG: DDE-type integrase/transposase/recombinase [Nostoc sp. LPT]|nr:DDE-type integrase/transposase/recombinase [Nostoc sp. LPT]